MTSQADINYMQGRIDKTLEETIELYKSNREYMIKVILAIKSMKQLKKLQKILQEKSN